MSAAGVMDGRVQADLSLDEYRVLQLLREGPLDMDLQVVKRDGRIVKASETRVHQREFTNEALARGKGKLREA